MPTHVLLERLAHLSTLRVYVSSSAPTSLDLAAQSVSIVSHPRTHHHDSEQSSQPSEQQPQQSQQHTCTRIFLPRDLLLPSALVDADVHGDERNDDDDDGKCVGVLPLEALLRRHPRPSPRIVQQRSGGDKEKEEEEEEMVTVLTVDLPYLVAVTVCREEEEEEVVRWYVDGAMRSEVYCRDEDVLGGVEEDSDVVLSVEETRLREQSRRAIDARRWVGEEDDGLVDESLVTVEELRPEALVGLCCRFCRQRLLCAPAKQLFARVLPQPSPYWAEMTELWYCHTTDDKRLAEVQIVGEPGRPLVGENDILLHYTDLNKSATMFTPPSEEDDDMSERPYRSLECSRCLALLGRLQVDAQTHKPIGSVHIDKGRIASDSGVFERYSAEGMIAAEMRATTQVRSKFRVLLTDPEAHLAVQIVIMNADAAIQSPELFGGVMRHVLKVMYRVPELPEGAEELQDWCDAHEPEALEAAHEDVYQLVQALHARNALLPAALRVVDGYRVGFVALDEQARQ